MRISAETFLVEWQQAARLQRVLVLHGPGGTGKTDRFLGVTKKAWREVLEDAAGVGLLTALGSGMYRIHPALPAYLATEWNADKTSRGAATRALVTAYAALSQWLTEQISSGNARSPRSW